MSLRSVRVRCGATLAVLVLLVAVIALDRWTVSREPLAHERLRLARTELQRAESLHAMLAASTARLPAMEVSEEALSLAILESAERARTVSGAGEVQYGLLTDRADTDTLRLVVQARVPDENALLQLLEALRTAAVMRPRRVAGCHVSRVPAADAPAKRATLALECALDWSWWAAT